MANHHRLGPTQKHWHGPHLTTPNSEVPTHVAATGNDTSEELAIQSRFPTTSTQEAMQRASPCLHTLQQPCSDAVAGMRVASLAAAVIANGWADDSLTRLISMLDCHFPQQFGNLNHSAWFVKTFWRSMLSELQYQQTLHLHSIVPALGIPSHLTRTFDSVTPNQVTLC